MKQFNLNREIGALEWRLLEYKMPQPRIKPLIYAVISSG